MSVSALKQWKRRMKEVSLLIAKGSGRDPEPLGKPALPNGSKFRFGGKTLI